MFDLLKMTRVTLAAIFLAVANAPTSANAQQAAAPAITDKSPTGELAYWNSIKDTQDAASFKAYLENFPNGMFYDVALAKFTALGGNPAELKPMVKGKAVTVQKKIVQAKIWKKPRVHAKHKRLHKRVLIRKHPKLRQADTQPSDRFGTGGGGGGGGGSGGGWGH